MDLNGTRWIVTGGSSGIGRCLVETILEKGAKVVVFDRDPLPFYHEEVHYIACDLAISRQRDEAFAQALDHFCGQLDFFVNNAGYSHYGAAWEHTQEQIGHMLEVNSLAAIHFSRLAVKLFLKQEQGSLIQVGSVAARWGQGQTAAYSASKAALHAWTVALREELLSYSAIRVTEVLPISTATHLFEEAHYQPRGVVQTTQEVVDTLLKGVESGVEEIYPYPLVQWSLAWETLFPNWAHRWVPKIRDGFLEIKARYFQ